VRHGTPARPTAALISHRLYTTSIVWLRRDLRLADHAALFAAATRSERVVLAFVLDPE
jgi:deoxyribodipyrimidine photolyase